MLLQIEGKNNCRCEMETVVLYFLYIQYLFLIVC